jgi:hypothetical protein
MTAVEWVKVCEDGEMETSSEAELHWCLAAPGVRLESLGPAVARSQACLFMRTCLMSASCTFTFALVNAQYSPKADRSVAQAMISAPMHNTEITTLC